MIKHRWIAILLVVFLGALLVGNTRYRSGQPPQTDTIDQPHDTLEVGIPPSGPCAPCHVGHGEIPDSLLTESWVSYSICKSCHYEGGPARNADVHGVNVVQPDTMWCPVCHNPHQHQDVFMSYYIKEDVVTPNSGIHEVVFADSFDFVHVDYTGICQVCHTQTIHHRNDGGAPTQSHYDTLSCLTCHPHVGGFAVACDGCHEYPPSTGTHLAHFNPDRGTSDYGDTRITEDFVQAGDSVYVFGCGNCHPVDVSHHINNVPNSGGGEAEVLFYDSNAPTSSLKELHPDSASYIPGSTVYTDARGYSYTLGECQNIYCHSTGRVASVREYSNMEWGGTFPGNESRCAQCHQTPPDYDNGSGVDNANAHYLYEIWNNRWPGGHVLGIHWEHDATLVANSTATLLDCNICHYATTTFCGDTYLYDPDPQGATCSSSSCHTALTDPPSNSPGLITNTAVHVNGDRDVVFSTEEYRTASTLSIVPTGWIRTPNYDYTLELPNTGYDPVTKTCTNAPCHLDQTSVAWGQVSGSGSGGWMCAGSCHNVDAIMAAGHPDLSNQGEMDEEGCLQCHMLHE